MLDDNDFIIKDFYCKKTGKHKPQRWFMYYCDICKNKRSYLPRNKSNYCYSCKKDLFLKEKLGNNYKEEVRLKEKIKGNLRNRLNQAIKNNQKIGSAVSDLGCSIEELKAHLESQFESWMSWDNWGPYDVNRDTWQIDHIEALANFDLTNKEEFKIVCHYSNLRPLKTIENLRKGKKICG